MKFCDLKNEIFWNKKMKNMVLVILLINDFYKLMLDNWKILELLF